MHNGFLFTASGLVVVALGLLVFTAGPKLSLPSFEDLPEVPGWVPVVGESGPVTVFVVGSPAGVAAVRKAVAPERVVAATEQAVALAEGRIIASSIEAAGEPLMQAGWSHRELELLKVERRDGLRRDVRRKGRSAEDEARIARLAELARKPTLTAGEAMFVLQAMDDGIF